MRALVLWLLASQGALGAFDTLYYHEWRARLPARRDSAAPELRLHAARDFLYAVIFGTLPWVAWEGACAVALTAILIAEIVLTLADFVVEASVRKSFGDVYAGERVTHAVMGILYGGMIVLIVPALGTWWSRPTALSFAPPAVPEPLRWALAAMAAGVLVSGLRDLYAALGLPHCAWPWDTRPPSTGDDES